MNKKLMFPLIAIFFITCQKDADIQNPILYSKPVDAIEQLKTPEQVLTFLEEQMPEIYTESEVQRVKSMLSDSPKSSYKRSKGNIVELPDGSVDGLQAAVDETGPGGTVIVKAGFHIENGLVTVGHRINLKGESGATIQLVNPPITEAPFQLSGGIHLTMADRSVISNIHFDGSSGAGLGIYINGSDRVTISQNSFSNLQFSIFG